MVDDRLILAAPAKVNLYLKITGRRPDGYHELNTLMQKLALYDRLELRKTAAPGIRLSCPNSTLSGDASNIAYRAAQLFFELNSPGNCGVEIVLHKHIPLAAGLGGGSSDAAAVLLGLNTLFAFGCTLEELAAMGLLLGADVPLFVADTPAAWATGIGEKLVPAAALAGYRILLVNPGIAVSTRWAYETFALTAGKNIFNLSNSQKEDTREKPTAFFRRSGIGSGELHNDLEQVTAQKYPVIDEIKNRLLAGGAAGAMMSGSGPTVFGLFAVEHSAAAEECRQHFAREFEQVYLVEPLR